MLADMNERRVQMTLEKRLVTFWAAAGRIL